MSRQDGWRWCHKCQGLFFTLNPNQGHCVAGGGHDGSRGAHYAIEVGDGGPGEQAGWRWCLWCQGMFYVGHAGPNAGHCPFGGLHSAAESAHYAVPINVDLGATGQPGWRWCSKCQSMYYGENTPNGNVGLCPAGLAHLGATSGHYSIPWEAPPPPTSKTFTATGLTTTVSLGGWVSVVLDDQGTIKFSGSMHNSGFDNIDGGAACVILTPAGVAYTLQHTGHTEGTIAGLPFGHPNRDDDWTTPSSNQAIKDDWANVTQATFKAGMNGLDSLTHGLGELVQDVIDVALAAVEVAATKAVIVLI